MDKQTLIDNLNEDLSGELGAIIQYITYAAMGGEPTTIARPVPAANTNREMLEAILAAEIGATKDYTERARQADELGDKGLAVLSVWNLFDARRRTI
jgi:bacterioferritin